MSCDCVKKDFPAGFSKGDVKIHPHGWCCGLDYYFCKGCDRQLGWRTTRADASDTKLYDGMRANEYIAQFEKFHV